MPARKMTPEIEKELKKKHYGIYNHSAVQICSWTKKSLFDQNFCYKQKFYGVDCHRCMELSPAAVFCGHNCIFCWRPMEFMKSVTLKKKEADEPRDIYESLLESRYKMINGFPGNDKINMKKFRETLKPSHFAISLSGEPTLYPKLPELIKFLKSLEQTKSIFLVTNGQEPKMLERLAKENALPTQLYVSVNAPNEKLFRNIVCPTGKDAWKDFLRSLDVVSKMKTRRIMRLTLIKGINMKSGFVSEYAELVRRMNPHFIEAKAYMWLGYSRRRLQQNNMPLHKDVQGFANLIARETGFEILDEKEDSRIVLLGNPNERIDRLIKSVDMK
jgi:tRNA wybutosine-synthesizing protein 1